MSLRNVINLLAASLIMIWAFLALGEGIVNPTLHNDEGAYIGKGWSYLKFSDQKDPVWDSPEGYDQPILTGYLYGWWLNRESRANPDFFFGFCERYPLCNFQETKGSDNLYSIFSVGGILQQTVLKARILSFLATWLLTGLLLLISWFILKHLAAGIVWVILLIRNPSFIFEMTRAKPDSLLLFCLVLLIFLIALWQKNKHRLGKNLEWFVPIFFGVLIGLTTAIKLNGIIGIFFLAAVIPKPRFLLTTIMTAWVVFVLVNPYTWKDPIKRTVILFEQRREQTKKYEVDSKTSYLGNLTKRFLPVSYNLIAREDTGLLPQKNHSPIVPFIVALSSAIFFVMEMFLHNKASHQRAVFSMLSILAITNYYYLSLDWLRYYLPLMLVLSFAISLLVTEGVKKLFLALFRIFFLPNK